MARRTSRSHRFLAISPLQPSFHYVVFLILALVLVVIVAAVLQQTAATTRARLVCPQSNVNGVNLVEELSRRCPEGVEYVTDQNGCGVWVCRLPSNATSVTPSAAPRVR